MPHLHIEYSAGLEVHADIAELCRVSHRSMIETGIFPIAGIRVRAFKADYSIVADGLPENNFVAMTLSVGAGRTIAALKSAGDHIFTAAQSHLAKPLSTPHFALSLEMREIHPDLNWKDTPIHARLLKPSKG